jgi:uncharacterized protein YfaS (alpha-2-macroglobulin family)
MIGTNVTFLSGQPLPDSAPRGTYNLQLKWVNPGNQQLACASGRFRVERPGLLRFIQ